MSPILFSPFLFRFILHFESNEQKDKNYRKGYGIHIPTPRFIEVCEYCKDAKRFLLFQIENKRSPAGAELQSERI